MNTPLKHQLHKHSVNGRFFLKSELKGDMLLKFKNGKYAFVWHNVDGIGDYLMAPFDLDDEQTTRGCLKDLTDDLYYGFWCDKKKDIIKVPCVAIYGSNLPGRLGRADIGQRFRQPIWNRYRVLKTCR
jgi:hypothetical protein